ncbi:MAG: methyltransferase domain-containing protein [Rhodoblastus sp.]|nr:MAG: methyltransferase domain-containing protein [Rhodoblastus sp.]
MTDGITRRSDDAAFASGDLAADRRLAWALASAREGDHEAAADLARQALERVATFAAAWFALAEAEEALGRRASAAEAYATALRLRPDDPFGAGARAARLDGVTPPQLAPAYVRRLFDDYASRFDAHLTGALAYRGPALLRAAALADGPRRFRRALDLGCGTGLSGEAFRDVVDRLEGCDLSSAMIAQARAKGCYDALETDGLTGFLERRADAGCDLVLAADVFVYLGDLAPVFAASARALAPGGLFAFTTQAIPDGEGWRLLDDLRFGHSADWVAGALAKAGFSARVEVASTRRDRGVDVPGLLVTARRA